MRRIAEVMRKIAELKCKVAEVMYLLKCIFLKCFYPKCIFACLLSFASLFFFGGGGIDPFANFATDTSVYCTHIFHFFKNQMNSFTRPHQKPAVYNTHCICSPHNS